MSTVTKPLKVVAFPLILQETPMGEGLELLLFLQAAKIIVSARTVRSFFCIMDFFAKTKFVWSLLRGGSGVDGG